MAKTVKLADIADEFGVSTVTVSKALSGQKGVSEDMRKKIMDYAEKVGYKQPSALRQEMRQKSQQKSFSIGVLVPERFFGKYEAFYLQMYQQINAKAAMKGCFTLLETVADEMEKELVVPGIIREKKVEGVIVLGKFQEDYLKMINSFDHVKVLYLDFSDESNSDCVVSDSYYGAYSMTRYLLEKGHTRIAYVGTLFATSSITDRYFGYMRALMEQGITPKEEWKIDDRYLETGKVDEVNLIQLPKEMPTAFFCNCDFVAAMLVKKLKKAGFRVPEDISVVGYDNYLYPGSCDIEITTYEVDMKEMARIAVANILSKITDDYYRHGTYIVEGHLVEKDSVRKLL